MGSLQVGVGRRIVTPPVGSILMGYAPRAAEAVHDDLAVSAIALEHGRTRALLISADICVLGDPESTLCRSRVADAAAVPLENIILCATHTHSGPAMRATPGRNDLDQEYLNTTFGPQLVKAAEHAVDNLQPARMGVATRHSDVGVNRRQLEPSGRVRLGQNPWGCHDPTMTVVSFRGTDGAPIANLVHYGAHCTAAGGNPEITRDWPGPMIDRLEAESGAPSVFFNGAEGDCGPRLPNGKTSGDGDVHYALELGARAGMDAVAAFRTIKEFRETDLRVLCESVRLPYEPLPTADDLEREIAEMGPPEKISGMRVMEHQALCERLDACRRPGPHATHLELKTTVLSVGPVAFVPFPFEMFSEITLRLRACSPFQHTLSLSNANGSYMYFPSQDQVARGGYEVWVVKSMHPRALADDADNSAVTESQRLLQALAGQR